MSVVTIPLRNDLTSFDFVVELDGVSYTLDCKWNYRAEAWFLSLYDADGQPISVGIRLVVGFPLGKRCKSSRMPPGVLQAQDTSGAKRDPGLEDLGSRVQLYYFSADELA
jgi:hypothetical protein